MIRASTVDVHSQSILEALFDVVRKCDVSVNFKAEFPLSA